MAKSCSKCGQLKPLEQFHRSARDGYQPWCKPCRKAYDAAYFARNRQRRLEQRAGWEKEFALWFRSLKEGRPCADCGGVFDPAAMQWDHLPGHDKRGNVADWSHGRSKEWVLEEISRCELVCANCHAARTVHRAGRGAVW